MTDPEHLILETVRKITPLKDGAWGRLRELAKENSDVEDLLIMVNQLVTLCVDRPEELLLLDRVRQIVKGMNSGRAVTDDFLEAYDQIEEAVFAAWPELKDKNRRD